jgi:hypothetical protein
MTCDGKAATVPLRPRERLVFDDLKAQTGLVSDADLLRLAIIRLADHYDFDLSLDLFKVRGYRFRVGRERACTISRSPDSPRVLTKERD